MVQGNWVGPLSVFFFGLFIKTNERINCPGWGRWSRPLSLAPFLPRSSPLSFLLSFFGVGAHRPRIGGIRYLVDDDIYNFYFFYLLLVIYFLIYLF